MAVEYHLELFRWAKAGGGYEWRDGAVALPDNEKGITEMDRKETRFLVAKPMEKPGHWRYNPLVSNPTLFREFASLAPTEADYAAFASEYGDLGIGVFSTAAASPLAAAEPFWRWRSAHSKMRAVADVLTSIQAKDATTLRQWFTVVSDGARYERQDEIVFGSYSWVVNLRTHKAEYLWEWAQGADSDDGALLRIAQGWAQDEINEAMGDDPSGATISAARVVFHTDLKKMTLRVVPGTLIGAMWFQCARVLTLNPTFRECAHCGKWFELSPNRRRKQAIYCSDRCKVAAYRKRKKD